LNNNFQDDQREKDMIDLFKLQKVEDEGRSGVDAFFNYNGELIPFELKTTSTTSVTTVRDFGPEHIKKWKNKHWLIGFFSKGKEFYKYASPLFMENWINEKEKYISNDFALAKILPEKIDLSDMFKIIGEKPFYSLEDAKLIQKQQYKKKDYIDLQDIKNGYSQDRMLQIIKDRGKYLIERGSTLNNPHIPNKYFSLCPEITNNHADQLKIMLSEYFKENP